MNIIKNNNPFTIPIKDQLTINQKGKAVNAYSQTIPGTTDFRSILEKKQEVNPSGDLRFSKHANERLASRNIDLSNSQLERLEQGTKKAFEKGINESLVMIDNLAFIVNVKNNTVVTAVNDTDDKVFTNIDGAVIN